MKKEISISIDPCSENPQNMLKTENGKFCFACSKNVIDFTQMTDNEIIQFLSKNSENQCGTFKKTQIDRVLIENENSIIRNYFTKTISFFSSLLILSTYNQTFANSNITETHTNQFEKNKFKEIEKSDSSKKFVKGKVIDIDSKEPIFEATVKIVGTNIRTFTDENGEFAIEIPDSLIGKAFSIEVFYIGFNSNKFKFIETDQPTNKVYLIEMIKDEIEHDVRISKSVKMGKIKKMPERTWFQKLFGLNK